MPHQLVPLGWASFSIPYLAISSLFPFPLVFLSWKMDKLAGGLLGCCGDQVLRRATLASCMLCVGDSSFHNGRVHQRGVYLQLFYYGEDRLPAGKAHT